MKYYIIAGEASGDLHASNLMKALKRSDPDAEFRCWGGDLMAAQGGHIVKHYKDLAFMGFIEVAMHLRTILKNLSFCKNDLKSYNPDRVILVDYPGFNLKIAKFAHEAGFKVVYYISPQVWAWKKQRVHSIKKYVDEMITILPFEQEFYAKYDFPVHFAGHPLLDAIDFAEQTDEAQRAFREEFGLDARPIIALLPGSRKQEIKKMLPAMLSVVPYFPDYQFVMSAVPWQAPTLYAPFLEGKAVTVVTGRTYELLSNASAALVTSGTATLETALFAVPEVVCYKGNPLSYLIAKWLIKDIQFISLVNLIMNRKIFTELIQNQLNTHNLVEELRSLLNDEARKETLRTDFTALKEKLGGSGASEKAAKIILAMK